MLITPCSICQATLSAFDYQFHPFAVSYTHLLTENDQLVKIKLDKSRIRHYEGTPDGERMKELGEISLRMVRCV